VTGSDSSAMSASPGHSTGQVILRRGVLSWFQVLAQSVSNLAPSAVVGVLVGYVAASAGAGAWLTWLIGTVVLLAVSVAIIYFARRYTTTGGLYGLAANAHPAFGYLVGWGAMLAIVAGMASLVVQFALFFGQYLTLPAFGLSFDRWSVLIIGLCVLVVTGWVSYRDIRLSAQVMLAIEILSILAITILMLVVLARHTGGLFEHSQLTLHGVTLNDVLLGGVLTVYAFSGFESATTLGQESRNPRRAIPFAVIGSVAIAGLFFIFVSYTIFLGFTGSKLSLATSSNPLSDVAVIANVAWYRYIVGLGVIVSMFSVIIAVYNGGSRYFFTLSRERLVPPVFMRLSGHKTPVVGILFLALVNVVTVVVVVAGNFSPLNAFDYVSSLSGYGSSFMYIFFAVAVGFFCVAKLRTLSPRNLGVVAACAVGAGGVAYVLENSFSPFPTFPLSVYLLIFCAVVAVAAVSLAIVAIKAPQILKRVGASVAADTELMATPRGVETSPSGGAKVETE
jgi:amino acid transporter